MQFSTNISEDGANSQPVLWFRGYLFQTDNPTGRIFIFFTLAELHWFGSIGWMSHTHWTMLDDFAILFPFKLPVRFLPDTCLNQCLPLQVMGWAERGAQQPPLKSTKINTIIEIFSSWLHPSLGLGWLLRVGSLVARGSKSSCIIWFCYWYEAASPSIKCLTVKHHGDGQGSGKEKRKRKKGEKKSQCEPVKWYLYFSFSTGLQNKFYALVCVCSCGNKQKHRFCWHWGKTEKTAKKISQNPSTQGGLERSQVKPTCTVFF